MLSHSAKVKDPVCEMCVAPEQNAVNCLGMHFAFCSQQCKERFLTNPHLYIGLPGEPAPKQTGQEVVKRRRLRLEAPLSGPDAQRLVERIHAMMGVYAVEIKAEELTITYDLHQATAGSRGNPAFNSCYGARCRGGFMIRNSNRLLMTGRENPSMQKTAAGFRNGNRKVSLKRREDAAGFQTKGLYIGQRNSSRYFRGRHEMH